ncbi:MAG: macro domain-containing protein [Oscillospiraceae bacterium]|nr:macro domain-containing protein [Oscillospiraceae bacterium]
MPLHIIRQDITRMETDAIVNAANPTLLGGGGVDGAIHKAAGKGLLLECMKLGGCKIGMAKLTSAHKLPCRYVIHTVGPKWKGGTGGEKELLKSCYRESLKLALEKECKSVAFPLISSGVYGYPKDKALKVAIDVIGDFLLENEMTVYIVIFDKASYQISEKLFADITEYIDDNYAFAHVESRLERSCRAPKMCSESCAAPVFLDKCPTFSGTLINNLAQIDESFSQMLLRKIDEKGMTDAQCYKKANIDRKLFSKIRSDVNYKPSKPTVIAFAISLELPLDEAEDMLKKAGFALSHSNKFDIIIEYFISKGKYDIHEINEALFAFDQSLLGA